MRKLLILLITVLGLTTGASAANAHAPGLSSQQPASIGQSLTGTSAAGSIVWSCKTFTSPRRFRLCMGVGPQIRKANPRTYMRTIQIASEGRGRVVARVRPGGTMLSTGAHAYVRYNFNDTLTGIQPGIYSGRYAKLSGSGFSDGSVTANFTKIGSRDRGTVAFKYNRCETSSQTCSVWTP